MALFRTSFTVSGPETGIQLVRLSQPCWEAAIRAEQGSHVAREPVTRAIFWHWASMLSWLREAKKGPVGHIRQVEAPATPGAHDKFQTAHHRYRLRRAWRLPAPSGRECPGQ